MKYLNLDESINIGGHKVSVNDLYQLQQSTNHVGQAICESFGAEGAGGRIISGVVLTDNPTDIAYTGGWMIKGGLLYKVNPLPTTTKIGGYVVWFIFKKTNTYPVVPYQSGVNHQVHQQREVDIVYINTLPSGTIHIDYTTPFSVADGRIEDIAAQADASTAAIAALLAAYNAPWTELDGTGIQLLAYSGAGGINLNSRFRWKISGSVLHFHCHLMLLSPSPTTFSYKFPTPLQALLTDVTMASILARDTRDTLQPCAVSFTPVAGVVPALISFVRSHANTAANTISFQAFFQITPP